MTTSESNPGAPFIRLGTGGFFVAPVFLGLATWLLLGAQMAEQPKAETPKINLATLQTGPAREFLSTDPPVIHINEFDRTCNECHKTFHNPDPRVLKLQQHKHIKLQHGINTHCYHCHHEKDRNALTLDDGSRVPFTQATRLCAQCHTSIYRDWERGLHGKRLGYWDQTKGTRQTLSCLGCHNPHWPSRPAMSGLRPLPGPNTLRMGKPVEHDKHESPDPLQRAVLSPAKSHR